MVYYKKIYSVFDSYFEPIHSKRILNDRINSRDPEYFRRTQGSIRRAINKRPLLNSDAAEIKQYWDEKVLKGIDEIQISI